MAYPILLEKDYLNLTEGAKLIKRTRTKLRLLLSTENKIIKHIYKRKWFSTATLWPYATRFINNAKRLKSKNILVPEINAVYFYPKLNCDILIYDYVDGPTLYDIACNNDLSFMPKFAHYIAMLHDLGIYFKDLHLGNIVVKNDSYTLLDLESIHCKRRALTLTQRAQNLKYMFSIKEHVQFYQQFGADKFLDEYYKAVSQSDRSRNKSKSLKLVQQLASIQL